MKQAVLCLVCLFVLSANIIIADELAPAEAGTFSLIALPDTQYYSEKQPESFYAQTQWVVDNLDSQNIVFVTHLGDIVQHPDAIDEWVVAAMAINTLDQKVPYGLVVGNHDMTSHGDAFLYTALFPAKHFVLDRHYPWYGGFQDNNMASFQTFDADGLSFIIVHLPCNAPDYLLKWADMVLTYYADRRAIISTHMFLGPLEKLKKATDYFSPDTKMGVMEWSKRYGKYGNTPRQMWDKCFTKYPNIFLILAGDQSFAQALYLKLKGDSGNTVHACMSDYKQVSEKNRDNGFLRIYRFNPKADQVRVITYSPTTHTLCKGTEIAPELSRHQFVLDVKMNETLSQKQSIQPKAVH